MTFAWYGHLKNTSMSLWKAIALSWGIAFFEYCLIVPANRYGFSNGINSFQLMNDGKRWWVVNIYWQAETTDNPIPAKYLN